MPANIADIQPGFAFNPGRVGPGQVSGTVQNQGTPNVPVRRRVRVHLQGTGDLLREAWSDPDTGAYEFKNIPFLTVFVAAYDHTGIYGGVIETDVMPELMLGESGPVEEDLS